MTKGNDMTRDLPILEAENAVINEILEEAGQCLHDCDFASATRLVEKAEWVVLRLSKQRLQEHWSVN
jgi:hypothetical protein